MSSQQVYRRLNEAKHLLNGHIQRGDKNSIILTENGFKVLEGIIEFEKQGKTLTEAVEESAKVLGISTNGRSDTQPPDRQPEKHDKLYETEYRSLIEQAGYLRGQLEIKDQLLKELKEETARLQEQVSRLREENILLKGKSALVEYRHPKRWWEFWRRVPQL